MYITEVIKEQGKNKKNVKYKNSPFQSKNSFSKFNKTFLKEVMKVHYSPKNTNNFIFMTNNYI